MDENEHKSAFNRWYQRSSKSTRVGLVVVLIAMVLGLIQWSNWQNQVPMCRVLEGCQLTEVDVQRMQVAFGNAGLGEFEVQGCDVNVPVSQKSQYLKALTDNGALPEHLIEEEGVSSQLNPFMTRSQQQLVERNSKKKQIREMLARLPFVRQVWFEMDVAEKRTAFQPTLLTAVVSIKPVADLDLKSDEVETVRQVVAGALAGIEKQNIVVTDLNRGRTIPSSQSRSSVARRDSVSVELPAKSNRKDYFASRIQDALRSYEGVEFEVQYTAESSHSGEAQSERFAAIPNLLAPKSKPDKRQRVGTNGTASIDDFEWEPELPEPSQVQMAKNLKPRFVEHVSVSIRVPEQLVSSRFGSVEPSRFLGFALEQVPHDALLQKFERLKSELIEQVRPVLPVASFQNDQSYPISVILDRATQETVASEWDTALTWAQHNWPTLAVLIVGFGLLVMVTRGRAGSPAPPQPEMVSLESSPLMSNSGSSEKSEAELQLSRLIENDPDAAAKVLKSWIRKAA